MSNCSASCTSVRSPLIAAIATFALKADVWFRRGLLLMLSPDSRAKSCPLSGRSSTYRPVQILEAGSPVGTLALPIQISERYLGTYLRYCPSYPAIELLVAEPVQCRGHWWRWFWFFDEFWFTDDFLSGNGFVF